MEKIAQEMYKELKDRIFPFWSKLKDEKNGGFYGYVDYDLNIDNKALKGSILNSRILWFFSAFYCLDKDEKALELAHHAYKFLRDNILDKENKGLYWMVDYIGEPADTRKHTYSQAFGIYGLAQYYKATGNEEALNIAIDLFNIIERNCRDENGYLEEFDRNWNLKENYELSEHGVISSRTMNTHLHILEAYTLLYDVWKNSNLKKSIIYLLNLFKDKIYSEDGKYLKVFFDDNWDTTIDIKSYGHDIEASWLLDRAVDVLGDEGIKDTTKKYTMEIAENILNNIYSPDGIANETVEGKTDLSRVWWVQAESVVGFFNAYQKTNDVRFIEASKNIWEYIKRYVIDKRDGGEWYWKVDENGKPFEMPIVEPWKCPYHNSRMCIEIIERVKNNEVSG
ncbi:AGE family epimerase/isomerase [Thermoanaerobacterium thermosaccharolyticum]|uniref:Cellobiose 2-epimerase n=1 Tax=Thermoanaerobacterium thermosaccharolyticum M0795 TaxID=698948 RepID=L0IL31_THETR|nr:AGE family epimerase/isomerase [Thermoanaerobacterium thermosaccharolyticum]AGB19553.1 N-acyl-D-glucosamine 2-epimerase [Thermoanaerobacterium thermosaccharolyticum M0795]